MAKGSKDKGFITWLFTIISLILGAASAIAAASAIFVGGTVGIILGIIWLLGGIYFIWHAIMIILGKASNSWLFVILAFIFSAIIGGILMLIAKIIN